jgi:hypothetical protein
VWLPVPCRVTSLTERHKTNVTMSNEFLTRTSIGDPRGSAYGVKGCQALAKLPRGEAASIQNADSILYAAAGE